MVMLWQLQVEMTAQRRGEWDVHLHADTLGRGLIGVQAGEKGTAWNYMIIRNAT